MHYDENRGEGQFLWTHTTASMGLAYQTTADESATTVMSRIKDLKPGDILVESVPFATKNNVMMNGHCSSDSMDVATSQQMQSANA